MSNVDPINIKGTDQTPEVSFDFEANQFHLRGMSFMEDASDYYEPLVAALESHLAALGSAEVRFDFDLAYFNSSSARVVLSLFDLLDETAERGNVVGIRWFHNDDEDMAEQGEEFGEDLEHATFEIIDTSTLEAKAESA